jgi:hypothetical protein
MAAERQQSTRVHRRVIGPVPKSMNRTASDVVENVHMPEQVELLKDHADLAPLC